MDKNFHKPSNHPLCPTKKTLAITPMPRGKSQTSLSSPIIWVLSWGWIGSWWKQVTMRSDPTLLQDSRGNNHLLIWNTPIFKIIKMIIKSWEWEQAQLSGKLSSKELLEPSRLSLKVDQKLRHGWILLEGSAIFKAAKWEILAICVLLAVHNLFFKELKN